MRTTLKMASVASFALAGCGLGQGDPTNSQFVTPSSTGVILETNGGRRGGDVSLVTGNTFGYDVGPVPGDGIQAFAGIAPGASVSSPPTTGSAKFNGTFEVGTVSLIFGGNEGVISFDRGDVALTANFGTGRLTGGGVGLSLFDRIELGLDQFNTDNVLTVDGTFSGETLTGTVTYDGLSGPLQGLVGRDEVIGVFHGYSDTRTHAGGFIAN